MGEDHREGTKASHIHCRDYSMVWREGEEQRENSVLVDKVKGGSEENPVIKRQKKGRREGGRKSEVREN